MASRGAKKKLEYWPRKWILWMKSDVQLGFCADKHGSEVIANMMKADPIRPDEMAEGKQDKLPKKRQKCIK